MKTQKCFLYTEDQIEMYICVYFQGCCCNVKYIIKHPHTSIFALSLLSVAALQRLRA